MTERFTLVYQGEDAWEHEWSIKDNQEKGDWVIIQGNGKEIVGLLNALHEETLSLKEQLSEAKADEKQLSISFIGYKQEVKETLQKHYDYADNDNKWIYEDLAKALDINLIGRKSKYNEFWNEKLKNSGFREDLE